MSVTVPQAALLLLGALRLLSAAAGDGEARTLFFIESPLEVLRVAGGEELVLSCEAGGTPQPEVAWYRDGQPVHGKGLVVDTAGAQNLPSSEVIPDPINLGQVRSEFRRKCVTPLDSGVYTCVAVTAFDRITSTTRVLIEAAKNANTKNCNTNLIGVPPSIHTYTVMRLAKTNGSVRLTCRAQGTPRPTVKWFDQSSTRIPRGDKRRVVLPNGDLLISAVTWEADMGLYTCVARSPLGTAQVSSFIYPTDH